MFKFTRSYKLLIVFVCFVLIGLLAFSLDVNYPFHVWRTEKFAIKQLTKHGYTEIQALDRELFEHRYPAPFLPQEDWFYFTAVTNEQIVIGRLICRQRYWDVERDTCLLENSSWSLENKGWMVLEY